MNAGAFFKKLSNKTQQVVYEFNFLFFCTDS